MGRVILIASIALLASPGRAQQEALQAQAAVRSDQVYVGQPFLLQIQIRGTDAPDPVDVEPLAKDFVVSEAGGGSSNSTSVTIVNGRMTQQVRKGYNLNYRIAPRRQGELVIPSLVVSANGASAATQPLRIRALPPAENEDFKLRLSLSESRAYVGQPVSLDVEWFVGREVREFSFTMPLLEDGRFEIIDPSSPSSSSGQQAEDSVEIALGDRRATAVKGVGTLDGRQFTVLRFRKLLVPKAVGTAQLPAASVTFVTPSARRVRSRGLIDDFFGGGVFSDVFGGRRVMETLSVPSNRPRLEVLDLPRAGRPGGFNGWIGEFEVRAEATPTAVKVGEPITLQIGVRGSGMLPLAQLPALHEQPALASDFNVPKEIGAPEERGRERVFTQTLRAKHDRVARIPPLELPYFDPRSGAYRVATTEPIPITVEPSRIVTAEDAVGRGAAPRQLEVESSEQGIAHNYVDASALEAMSVTPGAWLRALGPLPAALALLLLPPLAVCGLLAARTRGRLGSVLLSRAQSPRRAWRKAASGINADSGSGREVAAAVLSALRRYFGSRLAGSAAESSAWTSADVDARLSRLAGERGLSLDLAEDPLPALLKSVFDRCEAASYAGLSTMTLDWRKQLLEDAGRVVELVEERWR